MPSDSKVRRVLQIRFTMPNADGAHIAAMVKAAAPFYQAFGEMRVRLLQNADDPAKFTHEIEYGSVDLESWEDQVTKQQAVPADHPLVQTAAAP